MLYSTLKSTGQHASSISKAKCGEELMSLLLASLDFTDDILHLTVSTVSHESCTSAQNSCFIFIKVIRVRIIKTEKIQEHIPACQKDRWKSPLLRRPTDLQTPEKARSAQEVAGVWLSAGSLFKQKVNAIKSKPIHSKPHVPPTLQHVYIYGHLSFWTFLFSFCCLKH